MDAERDSDALHVLSCGVGRWMAGGLSAEWKMIHEFKEMRTLPIVKFSEKLYAYSLDVAVGCSECEAMYLGYLPTCLPAYYEEVELFKYVPDY